jgi:hypothetical protein
MMNLIIMTNCLFVSTTKTFMLYMLLLLISICYYQVLPVFENSCGAKKSEMVDPVAFQKIQKKSVKFAKIRPNRV